MELVQGWSLSTILRHKDKSAGSQLAVLDFEPPVFGMFKLIPHIFVLLVYGHHELQLLALLGQKLPVLLQQLFVGRKPAGISADPLVEGGLYCAYVVPERHPDELSPVHAYDPHSTWLLVHVVLLPEHIALAQRSHLDGLLPDPVFALQLYPFVDIGLSLHKKEDVREGLPLIDEEVLVPEADQLREGGDYPDHELILFLPRGMGTQKQEWFSKKWLRYLMDFQRFPHQLKTFLGIFMRVLSLLATMVAPLGTSQMSETQPKESPGQQQMFFSLRRSFWFSLSTQQTPSRTMQKYSPLSPFLKTIWWTWWYSSSRCRAIFWKAGALTSKDSLMKMTFWMKSVVPS